MTLFESYVVFGTVTDRNGANVGDAVVTVRNLSRNESFTTTGDNQGFAANLANFPRGYEDGDTIQLSASDGSPISAEIYISVDAGLTWIQVENEVETTVAANFIRKKIDTINFPGGMSDLNITLIA